MPSIQSKITTHTKTQENRSHDPEDNPSVERREMMEPADEDTETVIRKRNELAAWKRGDKTAIICGHDDWLQKSAEPTDESSQQP